MGWLSPLMTEGQRSQGSLKAEQEFLDITLMPLEVLMVINFFHHLVLLGPGSCG